MSTANPQANPPLDNREKSTLIRFHPGKIQWVPVDSSAPDNIDEIPFRRVYPAAPPTEQKYDDVNCLPSLYLLRVLFKTEPETDKREYYWEGVARAHCTIMILSDYPFPDNERIRYWIRRALRRAREYKPHYLSATPEMCQSIGRGIVSAYRRLLDAARDGLGVHYLSSYTRGLPIDEDTLANVADHVLDDNYIYLQYDGPGQTRSLPFRAPAILWVLAKVVLTKQFRDRYNIKTYFHPMVPVHCVILACAALRCAFDDLWDPSPKPRIFDRAQYGPIVHSLMYRWFRLDEAYNEETQILLSKALLKMAAPDVVKPEPRVEDEESVDSEAEVEAELFDC